MGGHVEPGLEGPVVIDCATDITADGGMGAASRSTLGLTGSSRMKVIHSVLEGKNMKGTVSRI